MSTRKAGKAKGDAAHAAHGPKNPAPEGGMSSDVINIGRHIFAQAIRKHPEERQALLEWLWGYAISELGGSRSRLCEAVGYDWTVIWRIFTGQYPASIDRFCESIAALRKRVEARGRSDLVETIVTERIFRALDFARDASAMVLIAGPTGRSKTWSAKAWARGNNHGRAVYIRVPSNCTRRKLVRTIAQAQGVGSAGKKTMDVEGRLHKAFSWRNVLIFDEAGHMIPRESAGRAAIEFVRDLHDMCGCGVALIVTDVYWDELRHGPLAAYFEQFIGRVAMEVRIPQKVLRGETEAAVRAFAPDADADLLKAAHAVANRNDGRLRTLFRDLARARKFADAKGDALRADHLRLAVQWRESAGIWPDE